MSGDRYRAGKRLWSVSEDRTLRREYPGTPTAKLAKRLRRSVESVYNRAGKLGLRKSDAYMASPAACRLRRGGGVGKAHRFKPGHVPANKGLRRPGWHSGRMKETQFKKGRRQGKAAEHHMPVGSTRLIGGYEYTKISDRPNVPYTVNWKATHLLLWQEHHGNVPKGHAVCFVNCDRSDIRIENLELVRRRDLMKRNTVHNLPKALVEVIQLRGALKRQINQRSQT